MRLVTKFELAAKNTYQLHGLHKEAFIELIKSIGMLQHTNALASLQKTCIKGFTPLIHPLQAS